MWLEGVAMNDGRIILTVKDLLEQDFNIDARGYRPQEVDKFLDIVIKDYTEYMSIIKAQETDIKSLTDEVTSLKQEIRRLNDELETAEKENSKASNNLDLLKRISKLEKAVYGSNE
jgi:DivIVA domain-containing protein